MIHTRFTWFARFSLVLLLLGLAALAPIATSARQMSAHAAASVAVNFPTVDPSYIYNQLDYMATTFQKREAGYDHALPVTVNGHDEFAAYWQSEMLKDLAGFGAQAIHDPFPINGWAGRPAVVNAFNVEVSVPGVTHPEQVVMIGCHYDGEASSTQSANDDASGCAIELGVAKALATYWTANHLYPARTLRFVIYDAEEQGIYGSFHYVNQTINGDLSNVVAMINEEQSGIGYPLRFLGKVSFQPLPMTLLMTPTSNNAAYQNTTALAPSQVQAINSFDTLMQSAAPGAFQAFQALGYRSLTYRDSANTPVQRDIFTSSDLPYMPQADDDLGGSDNYPFALAGLPTATFIGNYSYYAHNAPPWSYPYDQPNDTIQLMNIYASGSTAESKALELALALPGMLTTWTLAQSNVLGFAAADGKPLAAIGDIASTAPGASVSLAATAFDPASASATMTYGWSFGDGATAQGASVAHTWASAGNYPLTLTVTDSGGSRVIRKTIHVTTAPTLINDPYTRYPENGLPPPNFAVTLPRADESLNQSPTLTTPDSNGPLTTLPWWAWALIVLGGVLLLGGLGVGIRRGRNTPLSQADTEQMARQDAMRELLDTTRGPHDINNL